MITYAKRYYQKDVIYRFNRLVGLQSDIKVSVGDEVSPETIVATSWRRAGFRTFNIAQMFGMDVSQVSNTLVKTIGTRVYSGEVLARKKQLFGLREQVFKSPMNGIFISFDPDSGRITMQYLPEEQKAIAGVFGKILEIQPDKFVGIDAAVNTIHSTISFGIQREGSLVEIGYKDIPLQADQFTAGHEGKIVFGGSGITLDALYKALSVGVQAVVTGGVHYEDFLRLTGSKGRFENVGISLLAIEGYGMSEISSVVYDMLKESTQQRVFFEPEDSMLIMPASRTASLGTNRVKEWREFRSVANGDSVRILHNDYYAQHGIVKSLDVKNELVSVVLRDGIEIVVPVTDLEIII